jgi:hypothetical protein
MNNENKAQDLTIYVEADTYEQIEKLLNKDNTNIAELQFMLSLLGLKHQKRISLSKKDKKSDKTHTFSLRTMYTRMSSDYDAYIGLINILDNLDKPYHKVVNGIAFERTSYHNKRFLEMSNIKSFFEYMLGGIAVFKDKFLSQGDSDIDVADSIHDYLLNNQDEINDIVEQMLFEEEL